MYANYLPKCVMQDKYLSMDNLITEVFQLD